MKNLTYLTELDIADLSRLTAVTIENCDSVDVMSLLNAAPKLNRVRVTGIDWNMDNTNLLKRLYNMAGFDKDGYNTDRAVLSGVIHVSVIRQQEQLEYAAAWPDLEIIPNTVIEQFPVTFMNADGTVIEVQYVDKGKNAVDPTTRAENPITPTIESSVSHNFTFSRWDTSLNDIFSARTITAIYSESLRSYTIKYVSNGVVLQESTGLYGENVPYQGSALPTYEAEESGYVYYLFNRWDKSGYIYGDKVVNAVYDRFEYTDGAFDGKELKDLTPVEIYAMTRLDMAENVIIDGAPYTIVVGNDIEYDDIESHVLISEETVFDGNTYIDTGIKLFEEDRDFVLAIDYEMSGSNKSNAVLAQCYEESLTSGMRLWYGTGNDFTGVKFSWGSDSNNIVDVNKREVIVVQHKKGEPTLTIYKSNLAGDGVTDSILVRSSETLNDATLVFGASNPEEGYYENKAVGKINWAKLWFADLGKDVCKSLAEWTHESIELKACGFRKYFLTDNPKKRCSFSLLASHLLSRTKQWNKTVDGKNTNDGGWAKADLNTFLNTRLYNAMPVQTRLLMKKVNIKSSVGKMSTDVSESGCFITIPALIEVKSDETAAPYGSEGTPISFMTDANSRRRAYVDGDYGSYWLRSPAIGSWTADYYVYTVLATG